MNIVSHKSETPHEAQNVTIESSTAPSVDYTLYRADVATEQTIVFYPGMACNRFGHPMNKEPRNAVADLVATAAGTYNMVFPEVNMPESLGDTAPITGLTINQQNQRVFEVLTHVKEKIELGRVTYVGQSLGCLAVAQLIEFGGIGESERAIFWGPPTLEGPEHKEMLLSKFIHKEETSVDDEGKGQVQLGNGRLMLVSPEYWSSLDDNSLRIHYDSMIGHYEEVTAVCASNDDYYPNNSHYLTRYAPAIERVEIPGASHTFRPMVMRTALKKIMREILLGVK
jgi:hypothetical protein